MPEIAVVIETGLTRTKPRRRRLVLLAVLGGGLLGAGWRWWEVRRYRRAMAEIQVQIDEGRSSIAVKNLNALLAWKPDSDQAAYLLGNCEKARGRTKEASEAWTRVRPGSPFATRAIQGKMGLEIERGRLADAERLIKNALEDPRADKLGLGRLLGNVFCLEGRVEEAQRLSEASWYRLRDEGGGASAAAMQLVRVHIELQSLTTSVEAIRSALDQAARLAPDDDRVWLGKANLALRIGSLDEAARWLDACLQRRPDDVPVWRARLSWAMATGRVADAREALAHLPADASTPAQVRKLAVWLAARRGDADSERRLLEQLITADPADFAALDRLAELALQRSEPARCAEIRRKKSDIDRLQARYQKLYERSQPTRDAAEMARLAEQLGRWFEAKVFLTIATAVHPDRDDLRRDLARINQPAETIDGAGRTLAEVVAGEVEAAQNSS